MKDTEQVDRLLELALADTHGAVLLVQQPGDAPYLTSMIPDMDEYQIYLATDGESFDIWLNDTIVQPNQSAEQINQWLADNTPDWVYDSTPPTPEQREQVRQWMNAAHDKHTQGE